MATTDLLLMRYRSDYYHRHDHIGVLHHAKAWVDTFGCYQRQQGHYETTGRPTTASKVWHGQEATLR
jgi:hypothetical protein